MHKKTIVFPSCRTILSLKDAIPCRAARGVEHDFVEGDWVVAEMRRHPLKGDRGFYAELAVHYLRRRPFRPMVGDAGAPQPRKAPEGVATEMQDEGLERRDLTALDFVTIDSASTEDMDDALYAEETADGKLHLTVAIADPTAWIIEVAKLDRDGQSALVHQLPAGFNIPMLPA